MFRTIELELEILKIAVDVEQVERMDDDLLGCQGSIEVPSVALDEADKLIEGEVDLQSSGCFILGDRRPGSSSGRLNAGQSDLASIANS